jgi:hypothetical protein
MEPFFAGSDKTKVTAIHEVVSLQRLGGLSQYAD